MELMDIVNREDEVVGVADRSEVYTNRLMHRIVHVLVFNERGEMALQLRNRNLRYCPGHWSTAVGGHVQSGETYEEAALREMKEEIGIDLPVEFFAKDYFEGEGLQKFLGTYKVTYDGSFDCDEEVVERMKFFTVSEIKQMIDRGEKFHPELLFLLNKYFFS